MMAFRRGRARRAPVLPEVLTTEQALAKLRSKKRVESGNSFEKTLAQTHAMYEQRGLAMIEHLHPETSGAPMARYFVRHSACDYIGWWRPYGAAPAGNPWPVAFDAKSFDGPTLSLPVVDLLAPEKQQKSQNRERERMKRQCQFLLNFTHKGAPTAIGFLLVYSLPDDMGWFLFPDALRRLLQGEALKLRDKTVVARGAPSHVTHHFPHIIGSSLQQMAGSAPRVDWYSRLRELHPLLASEARGR